MDERYTLHKRIALCLGWKLPQVTGLSLPALRDLVRAKNPMLANEISAFMRRAGHLRMVDDE